jgi:hypothetical protein
MWIIVALGLLVLAFGVYTTVDAHREYTDISDEMADISEKMDQFTSWFSTVDRNGEEVPDPGDIISQADQLWLTLQHRDKQDAEDRRVDAENRRLQGLRYIGVGVVGLALAYLFAPERQPESSPDDKADTASSISDEVSSDPPD